MKFDAGVEAEMTFNQPQRQFDIAQALTTSISTKNWSNITSQEERTD